AAAGGKPERRRSLVNPEPYVAALLRADSAKDLALARAGPDPSASPQDDRRATTAATSASNCCAARAVVASTSSCVMGWSERPLAMLVTQLTPSTRTPSARATITSGTVDIPTASA